jgi:hypothetical protein
MELWQDAVAALRGVLTALRPPTDEYTYAVKENMRAVLTELRPHTDEYTYAVKENLIVLRAQAIGP